MRRWTMAMAAVAMALTLALGAWPAAAKIVRTEMSGPYKIVLNVLEAEPFYTAAEIKAKHIKMGMLVVGGAAPVAMHGPAHPNHHLVVHVYDKDNGTARTGAKVTLTVERLDAKGNVEGKPIRVPVVEMQMVGKGPISTHYGNNVYLKPGTYRIVAHVDGYDATYKIKL